MTVSQVFLIIGLYGYLLKIGFLCFLSLCFCTNEIIKGKGQFSVLLKPLYIFPICFCFLDIIMKDI